MTAVTGGTGFLIVCRFCAHERLTVGGWPGPPTGEHVHRAAPAAG
ncbi:MAG TPA: hypothetical protein VD813_03970 [Pseudonocardia sp.]|nr:hypothetical protein [Pseudonocardia sp.]